MEAVRQIRLTFVNYGSKIIVYFPIRKELLIMDPLQESSLMTGLVRLYPFCKRLLLHSPWSAADLTGTQRMVLLTSLVYGKMTMTQLSESIVCSKEQATRAVSPLVQRGLLARSFDPQNRTRVYIQLTQQGQTRIHQQLEHCGATLQARFSHLDAPEQQTLIDAFSTIYQFLSQDTPQQGGPL